MAVSNGYCIRNANHIQVCMTFHDVTVAIIVEYFGKTGNLLPLYIVVEKLNLYLKGEYP